eukprot:COSAG01_NODE_4653_length_4846_cov_2.561197_8_plen_211_part_01
METPGQDTELAERGWLCAPKRGRLLMFDGGLLHTVLPAYAARERDQPRLTLMCGLWDTDVTVQPSAEIGFPHAAMTTPATAAEAPWLQPLEAAAAPMLGPWPSERQSWRRRPQPSTEPQPRKRTGHRSQQGRREQAAKVKVNPKRAAPPPPPPLGVEVAPRFVSPVWESLVAVPRSRADGGDAQAGGGWARDSGGRGGGGGQWSVGAAAGC